MMEVSKPREVPSLRRTSLIFFASSVAVLAAGCGYRGNPSAARYATTSTRISQRGLSRWTIAVSPKMGIEARFSGQNGSNPTFTIFTRHQADQPWHKDYAASSVGPITNDQSFGSSGGPGTFRGQMMVRIHWSQGGRSREGDVVYQIR